MRRSTSAALVAYAAAVAVALLPGAAGAASDVPSTTFVLRGTVVQYIAPSGSMVGSLSLRVRQTSTGARRLVGELVTVAVEPGDPSLAALGSLTQGTAYTIALQAPSAGSILKGAGTLSGVTSSTLSNAKPGTASPPAGSEPNAGQAKPKDGDQPAPDQGGQGGGGQQGSPAPSPGDRDGGKGGGSDKGRRK